MKKYEYRHRMRLIYWRIQHRFYWLVEILCVVLGHRAKHCGTRVQTDYGDEYDDWWECARCKNELSTLFDQDTFAGRLKSWWYQE